MANNHPKTDQDINQDVNNTPPNHPDEYAIRYRGGSNPDLDVARDNDRTRETGQRPTPTDTSLGGAGLSQDAYGTQTGNPDATGDPGQTGSTSPNAPGQASGALGTTERPGPGGSSDRLGNVGGGTPSLAGQTTNMDAAGSIQRGDVSGQPGDEDRSASGSTGTIGATAYGTYNAPNDRTGPSNTSTGGGFDGDTTTTDGGAATPVMRRGGDVAGTDVMSGNVGTGAGADQVPQARTDTTLNEAYSTGPRTTDPEQELLNPGYDPRPDQNATGPNRAGDRVPPGLPGVPDQTGTLDQTTYSADRDKSDADAGTGGEAGRP